MRVFLLLSLFVAMVWSQAHMASSDTKLETKTGAPASVKENGGGKKKLEDEKVDEKKKMKIGGGLYTTDKVATVKSMKGNRPVSILTYPS